jgi:hypothetical protein
MLRLLFGGRGRTYGLSADFIYVKFIRHDLKVTHSRHVYDCLLISNIFVGKLMISTYQISRLVQ